MPSTEAPGDLEGVSTPMRDRAGQLGVPRIVEVELGRRPERNLAVTADTYSHVLADEVELDYAGLLDAR